MRTGKFLKNVDLVQESNTMNDMNLKGQSLNSKNKSVEEASMCIKWLVFLTLGNEVLHML